MTSIDHPGPRAATIARRAVVRGRVQGVGYRAWTRGQAELHGLSGWVRNRDDGGVEALLAGSADAVEGVLRALHEGPRGARVEAVEVEPADDPGPGGFRVRTGA